MDSSSGDLAPAARSGPEAAAAPPRGRQPPRSAAPARPEGVGGQPPGGTVGLTGALGVTISNMAPANGLFLTAPAVVAAMGTQAPWAFLLATIGLLACAVAVGQYARRIVSSGSLVAYTYHAYRTISPRLATGLASGLFYVMLLAGPLTLAAVTVFSGQWVASWLHLARPWPVLLSLSVLAFAGAVALRGIVTSSRVATALAAAQVLMLLGFSVLLLVRAGADAAAPLHPTGGHPGGPAGLSGLTFPLAVAGMIGWDNSAGMAAELRRPRRVIPATVIGALLTVGLLYTLSTWAGLAGYAHWRGTAPGADRFGALDNTAPFLELARHYAPLAEPVLAAVGAISSIACLVAAMTALPRVTLTGARAGMLPRALGHASAKHGAPVGALTLWLTLIGACTALPLLLGAAPTTVSAWEAGTGTVPLLLNLLLALVGLPLYLRHTEPGGLRTLRHLLVPLIGIAVIGWGVYGNIQPDQPDPGNTYWISTAVIAAIAAAGAARFARSARPHLTALGIPSEPDRP
ncbi:APC family permease [Streptomyces sp. WAC 04229]|uniref:APC family permease n=1 Tax=Streptomyces sp. WAC 04229 TaxID=2203206 RepID=UPI003D741F0D